MTRRPDRNDVLMSMAQLAALRGTCSRLQVGVVISKDGRILVTGYNGAPAGLDHCIHVDDEPCNVAEHAERNAIAFAARHGVRLEGSIMHVTHRPCLACARSVINAGISKLFYQLPFRENAGVELLKKAGIACYQYTTKIDLMVTDADMIAP